MSTFISLLVIVMPYGEICAHAQDTRAPLTFIVVIDISGSMDDRFPAPVQPRLTDSTKLVDVKRRLSLLAEYLPEGTRVLVTAFDHESMQLCDLRLDSAESRKQLQKHFASIESRNGSTYLWRTADTELARAKSIATANPENRVRVLLYTDGNDMENAPGLDHNTIIQKYGKTLQSVVKLDWICIGFDVQADVKQALRMSGVTITTADKPEDIEPLQAGFVLSTSSIDVGKEVSLTDQSIGIDIVQHVVDWGDQSPYEQGTVLRHRYLKPGSYKLRYLVKNSTGRSDQTKDTVTVTAPPPTPANIEVAKSRVLVGESVRAEDVSDGSFKHRHWESSDGQVPTDTVFDISFEKPGTYTIVLKRTDEYGRVSRASESVVVSLPAAPNAKFRFATKQIRIGEAISCINESSDSASRFQWTMDGKSFSTEHHPTALIEHYGEHLVELTVWDRFGQSDAVQQTLNVPRPALPVANFTMPKNVTPGEKVTLVDASSGEIEGEPRWFLDEMSIGSGRVIEFVSPGPGRHAVRLTIAGPGGEAAVEKVLTVNALASPRAGFTIGSETPFVGDVIKITDTSTGPIDRIQFDVTGLAKPIAIEWKQRDDQRWFELSCSQAGEVTIKQLVVGPGGQDERVAKVRIASRSIQPQADFFIRESKRRGGTLVRFINQSQGAIERFEFDPGDGSDVRQYDVDAEILHEYEVGSWTPKIVAFGPDDQGLESSPWIGPEIVVAKPIAAWISNLVWQVPGGLLVGVATLLALFKARDIRFKRHQKLIGGHLSVRKTAGPLDVKHVEFDGTHDEEVVDLDPSTKLKLRSLDDGFIHYQVELARDGESSRTLDLEEATDVTVGDYVVNYTA